MPSPPDLDGLPLVDGRRLDVRLIGPGDAPPSLVFLHEGLGSVELWRTLPADVAQAAGRRALVFSRYGHGWSEVQSRRRPVDFMDREAWVVLPELLEQQGMAGPILIGHSDGASIALLHASRHPVGGLVLLAPHVFTEPSGLAEIRDAKQRLESSDLAERMAKYHRDPEATFRAWNDQWLDPAFEPWNIEECLPRVTAPALLIQGKDDEYGTMAQVEAIESQLGGRVTRLDLDDCRHSPHLDRPRATREAAAEFIRRVGGGLV